MKLVKVLAGTAAAALAATGIVWGVTATNPSTQPVVSQYEVPISVETTQPIDLTYMSFTYPPALSITGADTESGLKYVHYRVDSEPTRSVEFGDKTKSGTTPLFGFNVAGDHQVLFWAEDNVGNESTKTIAIVHVDKMLNPMYNWATAIWSASKEDTGYPASNTIDSSLSTFWQLSNPVMPETVVYSLDETSTVIWIDHFNYSNNGAWWVDIWASTNAKDWWPIGREALLSKTPFYNRLYTPMFTAKYVRLAYHKFSNSTSGRIAAACIYVNKDYPPVPYVKTPVDMSWYATPTVTPKWGTVSFRAEAIQRSIYGGLMPEIYEGVVYLERQRDDLSWGRVTRAYYNTATGRYECTYKPGATYKYRFVINGSGTWYSSKTTTFTVTVR